MRAYNNTMMIVGIDEVGRGCWAGPLVAGAVVLPAGFKVSTQTAWKLADSKAMSSVSRELAETGIRDVASAVGIGWVSAEEVDSVGLTQAVRLAMWRALDMIDLKYDSVIIDGNFNFLPDEPRVSTMVKADALVPAVSAASIVAKVARDRWMAEASQRFPGYGFERHVGYGTRQHTEALRILGPCELHRRSFRPVAAVC